MKIWKITIVLFLALITLGTTALAEDPVPLDKTHFPDETLRSYLSSYYDKDKSGDLSAQEIESTKGLYLSGKKTITTLQGIEYLTALTYLDCSGNKLKTMDLSHNLALETLFCGYNDLTKLDVSQNKALIELKCNENELKTLDLSQNQELKKLWCDNSNLTKLNVTGCANLTQLYCPNNDLASLDLTGCTALTYIDCGLNELSALDLTGCPALGELLCYNNRLKVLDFHQNPAMWHISCESNRLTSITVDGCTRLRSLNCGSNKLTSIDVTGCASLESITCENNDLNTLDVSHNLALDVLVCDKNELKTLDVSHNAALTELRCSDNGLKALDVGQCHKLINLNCYDNSISSLDISQCPYLVANVLLGKTSGSGKTYQHFIDNRSSFLCVPSKTTLITDTVSDSDIPLTADNFPDDNFRITLSYAFDRNSNGLLSEAEIDVVRSINIDDREIASIEGIEKFTNLEVFSCVNTRLTTLDLSQNKRLYELDCHGNEISSLDISLCPALMLALGMPQQQKTGYVEYAFKSVWLRVDGDVIINGGEATTSVVLKDDVRDVGPEAFEGSDIRCLILTPVHIGSRAFANCQNLMAAYIDYESNIGFGEIMADDAFEGCNELTIVTRGRAVASWARAHGIPYILI